jgi:hypothetical protein
MRYMTSCVACPRLGEASAVFLILRGRYGHYTNPSGTATSMWVFCSSLSLRFHMYTGLVYCVSTFSPHAFPSPAFAVNATLAITLPIWPCVTGFTCYNMSSVQ